MPSCASIPLTRSQARPAVSASAAAARAPSDAGARPLSGFCGLTSHTTRPSPHAARAASATARWPAWGGSNEPPKTPARTPGPRPSLAASASAV